MAVKQLTRLDSSMLYAVGYDPEEQALEVVFWNGPIWRYEGVTPEEYEALLNAPSVGRRMREIIDMHPGEKLRYQPR